MRTMIYYQCQSKLRKLTICVDFKPFNFLVQQHDNTEPPESNTTNYILVGLFEWISLKFRMNMHVTQFFSQLELSENESSKKISQLKLHKNHRFGEPSYLKLSDKQGPGKFSQVMIFGQLSKVCNYFRSVDSRNGIGVLELLDLNETRDDIAQERTHTQRHINSAWSEMVSSTPCLALYCSFST